MTTDAKRDSEILILIARMEDVHAGVAGVVSRLDRIEAKIGDYPSAIDLARESVQDMTADQLIRRESGSGICGSVHQLVRNDNALAAELRRMRGEVAVLQSSVKETEPARLARTSDRKSNGASILGAAAIIITAIAAALKG